MTYRLFQFFTTYTAARKRLGCAIGAALTLGSPLAGAYTTFGNGSGSKWDSPQWETGATITWSFMTPAVGRANNSALNFLGGTNSLGTGGDNDIRKIIDVDQGNGVGAFDAAIRRAFATWARAADLHFVEVADSGADMAGSIAPDIRIGAFGFNQGSSGASGFGPPGDDQSFPDALAGDIAFNDLNNFQIAPGHEGDPLPTLNEAYSNDIEGLMLHEIGHTLGLGHSDVIAGVMCGYQSAAFDGSACDYAHINRQLAADDIAGIRAIYGSPVPLPPGVWLFGSALIGLIGIAHRKSPVGRLD